MPENFRVGKGRVSVLVSRWTNSDGRKYWRFRCPKTGRNIRRKNRSEARDLARAYLEAAESDHQEILNLPRERRELVAEILREFPRNEDLRKFLELAKGAQTSKPISATVKEMIAHKIETTGRKTSHLRAVELDLLSLADFFPNSKRLAELSTDDLKEWLSHRCGKAGPKRRNDCRGNLLSLFNYALKMGELPGESSLLVARRLPLAALDRKPEIRFASRPEALVILRNVSPGFRLWLVLGLFAGLRPEEIIPETARGRRGLDRREIDHETKTIYISREVAGKVKAARRVPFAPNLEDWLRWAGWFPGQSGPIGTKSAARAEETLRLGQILDRHFNRQEGWPQDLLRRTYASHRAPILRSLAALALEMGNSESILKDHYNQPLPEAEALAFFQLKPADLEEVKVIEFKRAK